MFDSLVDKMLQLYMQYEASKMKKKSPHKNHILPSYVTKRRIQIYNNGKIVFDSNDVEEIPEGIQYTIKSYGIPKNIKPNNKTPLVYNINTTLSSMFPSEKVEKECMEYTNKITG